jgi:hypothetical protein
VLACGLVPSALGGDGNGRSVSNDSFTGLASGITSTAPSFRSGNDTTGGRPVSTFG